ncbi:MAG: hypothetical protein GWN94_18075, partial [Phycisphaerae bacterium]|nr:hypothetical protein [Phycisphaerae bacterium]
MPVLDKAIEFSDAQTLSIGSGASIKSTVVADLAGKADSLQLDDVWGNEITPDIGESGNLQFTCQVATTLVGAGSLTVTLVSKAADASIDSGATTHVTMAFGATPAAGTRKTAYVPAGTINNYV